MLYQVCSLAIALALLALPLAGIEVKHGPILTPLATELVPLGTSLQAPLANPFQPPSLVAPARPVLGPSPSEAFAPNPDGGHHTPNITSIGFTNSGTIDRPNGRSPPLV